jgi:hypothetical protein
MKAALAVLAAAVSLTVVGTAASAPSIRSILGDWSGTLHQQGAAAGEVSFRIHRFGSSTPTGRVSYRGLDCSGRWTFLGLDRTATVFRFREQITHGASRVCKGVGIVRLRPLGGRTLAYRWTDGHLISAATVTRHAVSKP